MPARGPWRIANTRAMGTSVVNRVAAFDAALRPKRLCKASLLANRFGDAASNFRASSAFSSPACTPILPAIFREVT
jgi:hypothetical protein